MTGKSSHQLAYKTKEVSTTVMVHRRPLEKKKENVLSIYIKITFSRGHHLLLDADEHDAHIP